MPKKKRLSARRGVAHGVPRTTPLPVRKRRRRVVDPTDFLEAPPSETMTVKKAFSRLPNRYWIKGENNLWSSVERGSEAHLIDAGKRVDRSRLTTSTTVH